MQQYYGAEAAPGWTWSVDASLSLSSVTACVALDVGSRDESEEEAGLVHLLEHVLMSHAVPTIGTSVSTWADKVGGQSNASTSKDTVAFWVRLPRRHALAGIRALLEAVLRPQFTQQTVDTEVGAVLQELRGAAADPHDVANEDFHSALFGRHPMGRPTGGTVDNFDDIDVDRLAQTHRQWFDAVPLTLSVAGPTELADEVRGLATAYAKGEDGNRTPLARERPSAAVRAPSGPPADQGQGWTVVGGSGAPRSAELWPAFQVLTALVGGTPGSRLYGLLRQHHAIAYDLYSLHSAYVDCGTWRVTVGADVSETELVVKTVHDELDRLAQGAFEIGELDVAIAQASGGMVLDNEDPVQRCHVNAYWNLVDPAPEPHAACLPRRVEGVRGTEVAGAAAAVEASLTWVSAT